ncbi:MAG: putative cupredoxin-like copper-binding protein [Cellvibrionaceae bacterium]|jgi:uncharacterized cupredoxin-like copper-binding protein
MKTYSMIFFTLITVFLLAACGGEPEVVKPDPVSFNMETSDTLAFSVTELKMQSGAEVTINISNPGGLEHNWLLVAENKDPLTVSDADALYGVTSGSIGAGGMATVAFVAPGPGMYQYVCSVAGHAAAGMVGKIEVTP